VGALQWCKSVALKSSVAMQGTKEVVNYNRDYLVADRLRYTGIWDGAAWQKSEVVRATEGGERRRRRRRRRRKVPTFEKL